MWKFLKIVFLRAWSETKGFFGWNKKTLIVPLLFLVGLILDNKIRGGISAFDELVVAVLYGLIPIFLFALFLMLINILRAPSGIYYEQQRVIAKLENELFIRDTELDIDVVPDNPIPSNTEQWVRLRIVNNEQYDIEGCFTELLGIKKEGEQLLGVSLPIKFSWGYTNPHIEGFLDIVRGSSALLDVARTEYENNLLWFTTIRGNMFAQKSGVYKIQIHIGGEVSGVTKKPKNLRFSLTYDGGNKLKIK